MEGNALQCPLLGKVFTALKYQKSRARCQMQTPDPSSEATCITEHPGFCGVCLDMWVLQTTAHHIRHTHGQGAIAQAGPTHKYVTIRPLSAFCTLHSVTPHCRKYRYIAHSQLTTWCWGYLGKQQESGSAILCCKQDKGGICVLCDCCFLCLSSSCGCLVFLQTRLQCPLCFPEVLLPTTTGDLLNHSRCFQCRVSVLDPAQFPPESGWGPKDSSNTVFSADPPEIFTKA